jgi:phenylacetate-CoA ligase
MNLEQINRYTNKIPIYKNLIQKKDIPIINKQEIAEGFPQQWLTPETKLALEQGKAECVQTTGTSYDRMRLIRPPFFLMKQYFNI